MLWKRVLMTVLEVMMWIKVDLWKRNWIQRRKRKPPDLLLASMKRRKMSEKKTKRL